MPGGADLRVQQAEVAGGQRRLRDRGLRDIDDPEGRRAHKNFDVFDAISNPEGNIAKAQQIIRERGNAKQPCESTVRVAFPDTALRRRLMNTVVEAYQRVGIQVELVPIDPEVYYDTGIGDPTNDYDLMLAGWIPDWANGSAILPPLFHSNVIPKINPVTGHAGATSTSRCSGTARSTSSLTPPCPRRPRSGSGHSGATSTCRFSSKP